PWPSGRIGEVRHRCQVKSFVARKKTILSGDAGLGASKRRSLRDGVAGRLRARIAHYCTLSLHCSGVLAMTGRRRGRWLYGLVDDRRDRLPVNGPRETRGVDEAGRSRPATGCCAPGLQTRERRLMSDRQDLPAVETIHQVQGGW